MLLLCSSAPPYKQAAHFSAVPRKRDRKHRNADTGSWKSPENPGMFRDMGRALTASASQRLDIAGSWGYLPMLLALLHDLTT